MWFIRNHSYLINRCNKQTTKKQIPIRNRMSSFTIPKRRIHHSPMFNTNTTKFVLHRQQFHCNRSIVNTNQHQHHFRVNNRGYFTSIKHNQIAKSIQTVSPATYHQYKHFTQQQQPPQEDISSMI